MSRNTVFSQILQLICQYQFKKCVTRYEGDKYTKRFSFWQHGKTHDINVVKHESFDFPSLSPDSILLIDRA